MGDLASHYAMSRPVISQHLAVLERAGLIERTSRAQWRECRVSAQGLDGASTWIARHRADWNERFDLLDERKRARRDHPTPDVSSQEPT